MFFDKRIQISYLSKTIDVETIAHAIGNTWSERHTLVMSNMDGLQYSSLDAHALLYSKCVGTLYDRKLVKYRMRFSIGRS